MIISGKNVRICFSYDYVSVLISVDNDIYKVRSSLLESSISISL